MRVTTKLIVELVALETGVSVENIARRTRERVPVQARQLAAWLARRSAPKRRTYPIICAALGLADHQSVMYACRIVEHRIVCLPWWGRVARRLLRLIEMIEADDPMATALLAALRRQGPELLDRRRAIFEAEGVASNPVWKNMGIRRGFPELAPEIVVVSEPAQAKVAS
jgi:hypothetical protein